MRSRTLLTALALTSALVLTACSSSESEGEEASPTVSETASPETDTVQDVAETVIAGEDVGFSASGAFGEKPTLTFDSDTVPEGLQVSTLIEGDGAEVTAGSFVVANYLGQVWDTETVFDNSYDRGAASGFSLNNVIEGWSVGLVGQKAGSRVLLTIPPEAGYGPSGGSRDGTIRAEDTIVFVVDIVGTFDGDSSGQADAALTDAELPVTITGAPGSPVSELTVNEGEAEPTEVTMTVVAEGTGAPVGESDQVVMQMAVTSWDNTQGESSWAPEGTGPDSAYPMGYGSAFDQLVGVPVGSRVLLESPGSEDDGTVAVAVVVDVLDVIVPTVS